MVSADAQLAVADGEGVVAAQPQGGQWNSAPQEERAVQAGAWAHQTIRRTQPGTTSEEVGLRLQCEARDRGGEGRTTSRTRAGGRRHTWQPAGHLA
jgi:hypothetical protein